MSSSIEELQHEFSELEHQWFIDRSSDRPPTAEQMDRVMRLAKDALTLADSINLDDIKTNLKHRMETIINEEVVRGS